MDRSVVSTPTRHGWYAEESVKTPGYQRLVKAKARLPLHPYKWERTDQYGTAGFSMPRSTDRFHQGYVQFPGTYLTRPIASFSNEAAIVQNRLLEKIRNTQVDLGVALGEYRETARFVSGALVRTSLAIRQLRRGNLTQAFRALHGSKADKWKDFPKSVSQFWLSLQYGIRPLIKDVFDSITAVEKAYSGTPPKVIFRSGHLARVSKTASLGPEYWGAGWVRKSETIQGEIRTSAGAEISIDNPLLRTLDQCGVLNPASIAWELVPFSFVVDWFLPVGDFLSSVIPPQGISWVEGWMSQKSHGVLSQEDIDGGLPPWRSASSSFCVSEDTAKYRTLLTGFPSPKLLVPDVSLSKSQVASGLALLIQAADGWSGKPHRYVSPPVRKIRSGKALDPSEWLG